MRRLAPSLGLASLLLLAASSRGEESPGFEGRHVFRIHAEEDGLTALTPQCLLQDRAGFLWVGTQDGLYRFDGRRFERFGTEDGLPSSRVNELHQTSDGRLYAGTRGGLARFDGIIFMPLGASAGLPESTILAGGIESDAEGNVYVGTGRGLFLSIGEIFHVEARKDGPEVAVSALSPGPEGTLWLARGGQLYRREKGVAREVGAALALPPDLDRIDATLTDAEGALWVRTLTRLFRLPKGADRFEDLSERVPPSVGSGQLRLSADGVLIPTQSGLLIFAGGRFRKVGRREGLEGETVLSALSDREGSLWVGLAGIGLARRLGRGRFTSMGAAEGLPHDLVWSIVRDRSKEAALWVGTQDGLGRIGSDGAIRVLREADGSPGRTVYALAAAQDGSVLAGGTGGVSRLGPGVGPVRRYRAEVRPGEPFQVLSLHLEPSGEIWAGTRRGVYRAAAGSDVFREVPVPGGTDADAVYSIARDAGGVLWAAGREGLLRLAPQEPRRFGKRDGLGDDFLVSMATLPDGGLLVGYREALGTDRVVGEGDRIQATLYGEPKGKARMASDESAPRRKVLFLGVDARGAVWVGGSGVDEHPAGSAQPIHHDRADGLVSRDAAQNAFFADADGTVWFGTSRGLVRVSPNETAGVSPPPPVALREVWAGGRRFSPDRPASLAANERDLRIGWAGLSFAHAASLRFRYRLQGFDDGLTETQVTEATLQKLPAGTYRFEVLAVAPDGRSSPKPATFSFTIAPSLLESRIVRALLSVLGAVLVLAFIRWRVRAVEADRQELRERILRLEVELEGARRATAEAAFMDPLTKLRNRLFLFETIEADIERSLRAFGPSVSPRERKSADLIVYLIDIDGLKEVNERFGSQAGDAVLLECVQRLKGVVRASDYLLRWGAEDFLVLSRSSARDQAHLLPERILNVVGGTAFVLPNGQAVRRTCSIGWAAFPWLTHAPSEIKFEEVLALAERAIGEAESRGRNRAVGVVPASAPAADGNGAASAISAEAVRAAFAEPLSRAHGDVFRTLVIEGPAGPT